MKWLKLTAAAVLSLAAAHAQSLLNFSSTVGWDQLDIAPTVSAGRMTFRGDEFAAFGAPTTSLLPVSSVLTSEFALVGTTNTGNTFGTLLITFFDQDTNELGNLNFDTSLLGSAGRSVTTPNWNASSGTIAYATIQPPGIPGGSLNITLESLSVVPEPSQVALGLGLVAVGAAVIARRRKAA